MATRRQIEANRRNAQRSTGPRTRTGKAAAKLNSLKHGLLAEQPVIRGEDEVVFEALRREVTKQFDAVGVIETQLVERISGLIWRLRRLGRIEGGIIDFQRQTIEHRRLKIKADRIKNEYEYGIDEFDTDRAPQDYQQAKAHADMAWDALL